MSLDAGVKAWVYNHFGGFTSNTPSGYCILVANNMYAIAQTSGGLSPGQSAYLPWYSNCTTIGQSEADIPNAPPPPYIAPNVPPVPWKPIQPSGNTDDTYYYVAAAVVALFLVTR